VTLVQIELVDKYTSECGHKSNRPLSSFSDRVFGLYSPPGEIRFGGSAEFGATQTVPYLDLLEIKGQIAKPMRRAIWTPFTGRVIKQIPTKILAKP
jgi:hypothetical protein